MAITSRFHQIVGTKSAETEITPVGDPIALQVRADDKEAGHAPIDDVTGKKDARPAEDAQVGVQKIEAVTLAWGKGSMLMVLILYASLPSLHYSVLADQLAHVTLFQQYLASHIGEQSQDFGRLQPKRLCDKLFRGSFAFDHHRDSGIFNDRRSVYPYGEGSRSLGSC
jgi:hypothetical protein